MIKFSRKKTIGSAIALATLALGFTTKSFATLTDAPPDSGGDSSVAGITNILKEIQNDVVLFVRYVTGDNTVGNLVAINNQTPNAIAQQPTPDLANILNNLGAIDTNTQWNLSNTNSVPMQNLAANSNWITNTLFGQATLQSVNASVSSSTASPISYLYSRAFATGLGITNPLSYDTISSVNAKGSTNPADLAMDFDNFISPLNYSNANAAGGNNAATNPFGGTNFPNGSQQEQANNFVTFITYGMSPFLGFGPADFASPPSGSILDESSTPANQPDKAHLDYLNNLRQYLAYQSIGLSNMREMFNRRVVIAGLGTQGGITQKGQTQADASQLQLEHFMAYHRLDPNYTVTLTSGSQPVTWHAAMEQAQPKVVARETLYVLAEINYQLFLMRQQQERMLATHTANLMMSTDNFLKGGIQPDASAAAPTPGTTGT